jgi:uncharacterized protein DUF4333
MKLSAATIAVLAAATVAFVGCGSLDTNKAQREIAKGIKQQNPGVQNVTVKCPSSVDQKKNKNFECKVTGDVTGIAEVVQTNDSGHITYTFSGRRGGTGSP